MTIRTRRLLATPAPIVFRSKATDTQLRGATRIYDGTWRPASDSGPPAVIRFAFGNMAVFANDHPESSNHDSGETSGVKSIFRTFRVAIPKGPSQRRSLGSIQPLLAKRGASANYDYPLVGKFQYSKKVGRGGANPGSYFGVTRYHTSIPSYKVVGPVYGRYYVTAPLKTSIQWQVHRGAGPKGQKNVPHEHASVIHEGNYQEIVDDLTPDLKWDCGRPHRKKYWAQDLTVKHEKFHATEAESIYDTAVKQAVRWFQRKKADNRFNIHVLLAEFAMLVDDNRAAIMKASGECRAYADGATAYAQRANRIQARGDAGKYPIAPLGPLLPKRSKPPTHPVLGPPRRPRRRPIPPRKGPFPPLRVTRHEY